MTDATLPALAVDADAPRQRMTSWRMLRHQTRYDLVRGWRNRQSRFFAVLLPAILLVLFTSLFGNDTFFTFAGPLKQTVFYVPGLTALGIVNAACLALAIAVVTERQTGILKRRRSKPVPAWVIIGGRCLTALVTVVVVTGVLFVIGAAGYGVVPRAAAVPGLVCTIVVGTAAFACLGYAIAPFLRDPESAQSTTQAVALPLYFISSVFLPPRLVPPTLRDIARCFPIEHLSHALFLDFNPHLTGAGFDATDLGVVAAWGVAGLAIAVRRFEWMPRAAQTSARRGLRRTR